MDELKKNTEEEKDVSPDQNTEAPVTLSDDDIEKVAGGCFEIQQNI